jgi:hypothetical protein
MFSKARVRRQLASATADAKSAELRARTFLPLITQIYTNEKRRNGTQIKNYSATSSNFLLSKIRSLLSYKINELLLLKYFSIFY